MDDTGEPAAGRQRRPLSAADRALLSRVIALAEGTRRYSGALPPGLRGVLGDGSRAQARDLTVPERGQLERTLDLVGADWARGLPPASSLSGAEAARLALISRAVALSLPPEPVLVNAEDWAPPQPVPQGWAIANSPEPLGGLLQWEGPECHGCYYAASPWWDWGRPGDGEEAVPAARPVRVVSDEWIAARAGDFLHAYRCPPPGHAGLTTAEIARDLGFPWKGAPAPEQRRPAAAGLLAGLAFPGRAALPAASRPGRRRAAWQRPPGGRAARPLGPRTTRPPAAGRHLGRHRGKHVRSGPGGQGRPGRAW